MGAQNKDKRCLLHLRLLVSHVVSQQGRHLDLCSICNSRVRQAQQHQVGDLKD